MAGDTEKEGGERLTRSEVPRGQSSADRPVRGFRLSTPIGHDPLLQHASARTHTPRWEGGLHLQARACQMNI